MIQGKDSILSIKFEGNYVPISCETSTSFSESSEMVNTTTRDNEGWTTSLPTSQSYEITLEGQCVIESASNLLSYWELVKLKRAKTLVEWKINTLSGAYVDQGFAYINSINNVAPADAYMTFTMTMVGYGKAE